MQRQFAHRLIGPIKTTLKTAPNSCDFCHRAIFYADSGPARRVLINQQLHASAAALALAAVTLALQADANSMTAGIYPLVVGLIHNPRG